MISTEQKELRKINRIVAIFNMIPNLVWTVLFLLPVAVFCYDLFSLKNIFIMLGLSFIPIFFPNSFFDAMQLSKDATFYKRIGVRYINHFAQNGTLLNKYLRHKYPQLKSVSINKVSIKKQYYQTYFFEKFHFALFIFFMATTIAALGKNYFLWAVVIFICNLFYNIYPNLLQQYVRLKLRSVLSKF